MQGELAVASALHPQLVDDIQGGGAQHLVLFVRQSHRRGNDNGVAGVHAHGVQVLHGADGNGIARAVPHDLELDLLPPGDALFHQHLGNGRKGQAVGGNLPQLFRAVDNAAAGAAQGKGRADDNRVADFSGKSLRVLHGGDHLAGHAGLADALHGVLKELPVLRLINGLRARAQQAHMVLLQKTLLGQLHGEGQARLPAKAGENAVRLLLFNDALHGGEGQGLNVNFVRHGLVCHNGGRVGVYQHNLNAVLPQSPAGLGAGVVELRRLADDNGSRADDQYLFDVLIQWHSYPPFSSSSVKTRTGPFPSGPMGSHRTAAQTRHPPGPAGSAPW